VIPRLRSRGHAVIGLARSDGNVELLLKMGAEAVGCDLFSAKSLEAPIRGCDAVLHLATSIPRKRRPRLTDFALNDRIRTEGTRNLLAAALRCGVKRYTQQSIALLHSGHQEAWADEDGPLADHPLYTSAIEMERMVWQSQGLDGLTTVILRGGLFYGPTAWHTRHMFGALRSAMMPIMGAGDNYWSLIHTDDMASACVAAVEAPTPSQLYLVVDDEPVQVKDFFTHVAGAQERRPPRHAPAWLVSLLAGPLARDMLSSSYRCRNRRIKHELDWAPSYPTYKEGVAAILDAWSRGS
jgi:nucleoside-diphosphate-sugar epimerase